MVLLASFFSSSHAIQKSMFSSLNSVRRNSRNAFLPAGVSMSLSKDWAQALASSRLGPGLGGGREKGAKGAEVLVADVNCIPRNVSFALRMKMCP